MYKLFHIMTPINVCFIAGSLITFASLEGVLGSIMAENLWHTDTGTGKQASSWNSYEDGTNNAVPKDGPGELFGTALRGALLLALFGTPSGSEALTTAAFRGEQCMWCRGVGDDGRAGRRVLSCALRLDERPTSAPVACWAPSLHAFLYTAFESRDEY